MRLVLTALLVTTTLAAASAPRAADDDAVMKAMAAIAGAFRTEKPDLLTSLLPPEGKVFISLHSIGGGAGYYGRDQVYFIFQQVFSQRDTVRFDIRSQSRGSLERDRSRPGVVLCVGAWTSRRQDAHDEETFIHFVLSLTKGRWSLVEIREAQ